MNIKINAYTPEPYGDSQLGYIDCTIDGKIHVICKLCKSKAGHEFVAWPSQKIAGQWKSSIALVSSDADRKLRDDVLQALRAHIAANQPKAPVQQQNTHQQPASGRYEDFPEPPDELPF